MTEIQRWEDLCYTSVETAVSLSLKQTKPLLVIVAPPIEVEKSKEEQSNALLNLAKDEKVLEIIQTYTVPLEVVEGTQDYNNFAQFFPVNSIPSIYIIKESQVLDVFTEAISRDDFIARFERVVDVKQKQKQQSSSKNTSADSKSKTTNNNNNTNVDNSSNKKKSDTEKYQEKVRKERKADSEERKRILKLVEDDRKERQRAAQQARRDNATEEERTTPTPSFATDSRAKTASSSSQCALSIRLFDGRALKHRFSSTDTLQIVRNWVDKNRTDGDQPYFFFQTIPKKIFEAGEEAQTLRNLELTPSSTLILKPISNYSSAYNSSAYSSITPSSYYYSPVSILQRGTRAVGDALYTFLGLGHDPHSPDSSHESSRSASPTPTDQQHNNNEDNSSRSSALASSSSPNVRTLNNSNDDRTTYNGNQLSLKDDKPKDA